MNGLGASRVLSGMLAAWCCAGAASVGAAERNEPEPASTTEGQRPARAPHLPVTATAIAEHTSVGPGSGTRIGILFDMDDGWHIYWKNPGDAGVATQVTWSGPEGVSIGPLDWPVPQEFLDAGNIHTFGYTGSVVLSNTLTLTPEASTLAAVPLHPPSPETTPLGSPLRSRSFATAQQGGEEGKARVASERFRPTGVQEGATGLSVGLHAALHWVACRQICIPGSAALELNIPVSDEPPVASANAGRFPPVRSRRD